ncbi:serine protease [Pseudonocardia tropica]|uniref:Serine protease n=1 Tax=Pseudonocardia tropica TaxID=681289 RepID=A0ABV1K1Z4_9PSEU
MPRIDARPQDPPRRIQRPQDRRNAVRAAPELAWRRESPDRKISYAERHGIELPSEPTERQIDEALERVFAAADFLPSRWLTDGAKRCDAVARILTAREKGTGFLVSPWLLLTNNHVLADPVVAEGSVVTFRYVEDGRSRISRSQEVALDPGRCFVTSPESELDYTLVAVSPLVGGKAPGKVFGGIPMRAATGKILSGHPVNIIQHPDGRPREIAVRNNLLIGVDDDRYLTYETDSEPGSSGAPVLSDAWELVALHRSAESARNDRGEQIDVDGRVVTPATSESRRVWVANKGVRISAIVADVQARTLGEDAGREAHALVEELLRIGGNR